MISIKSLPRVRAAIPSLLRRLILSWLLAVTAELLLLPAQWRHPDLLEGIGRMSLLRVLLITGGVTVLLTLFGRFRKIDHRERWLIPVVFSVLATVTLCSAFTWPLLVFCLLLLVMFVVYAVFGWNKSPVPSPAKSGKSRVFHWITLALALAFVIFLSLWLVGRILCFYTPTYDFGLFAQMFHSMKTTGLPMTTLERDGMLSHFAVHVSPIWYLLLPVYWVFPFPATLQVMQGVVMASAVIPLWKLGKHYGLTAEKRMLLCAVLLLLPAYAGGTSYDIHENCFLTPLILWLLYGIERKNAPMTLVAAVLTLMVKEDAAVYVAVIALWLIVSTLVKFRKGDLTQLLTGVFLLLLSLGWFLATTHYLSTKGDGVMTGRYSNFMYDGSGSLITVIKAVIMDPMKAIYECVDQQKLGFIALTLLPMLGLPLITRRYERYILLIPYILINLMSDYQYQHNIFFQYTFGTNALLIYLALVNLADLKIDWLRLGALAVSVVVCGVLFGSKIVPEGVKYPKYVSAFNDEHEQIRKALNTIPPDASVTAGTFLTTHLSQREILYDICYCSWEHVLETEYVALQTNRRYDFRKYDTDGQSNGKDNLLRMLEENGYEEYRSVEGSLLILKRSR